MVLFKGNKRGLICALLTMLACSLFAKTIRIPPLPVSPYADTEISTNASFNSSQNNVTDFEFKFLLLCSSSNSIQVAFGKDIDSDGILSLDETSALYQWRNECFCIEDVKTGVRYEEKINSLPCEVQNCDIKIALSRNFHIKSFSAEIGNDSCFKNLSTNIPSWLFDRNWNLMRITRRGTGIPSEWFKCDIGYQSLCIFIK